MTWKTMVGYALLVVVLTVGCRRGTGQDTEGDDPSVEILERLAAIEQDAGVPAALDQGVAVLAALEDPAVQDTVWTWLIARVEKAAAIETVEGFLLQLLTVAPRYAERAVIMLEPSMMQTAPDAWMQLLQAEGMPPGFRVHGYAVWFNHFSDEAPMTVMRDKLLALLVPELQGYTGDLFRRVLQQSLQHADPNRIWALLEVLQEEVSPASHVRADVLHSWGSALLRDGRFADAWAHYQAYAQALGDQRLVRSVTGLLQQVSEQQDAALRESVLAWVYAHADFPMLRSSVVRWELQQLRTEADAIRMVTRVQHILGQGMSVDQVSSSFLTQLFYPVLRASSRDEKLAVLGLLQQMAAAATASKETVRSSIATAMLDTHFYLEDFKGALDLVQAGIPGYDAEWHVELHDKVQAHLAQAEGRAADAVSYYARHIERVRGWKEPMRSPEDGRLVVSDEVIGLNERRIGDIWQSEGRAEEAAAAYARARKHYESALDQYADDAVGAALTREALVALENTLP